MNAKKCPESIELRQLLEGTLSGDRQQACTEHMDSCHGCQVKLEDLATEGSNLSQIVESLNESQVSPASGYWQAAKSLEEAVRETFVPDAPVRRRDASLEFLQPASDSAYIGRLAQFDVMRVLGRGGMGLVLEAFDTRLQRNVAIKVLDPDLAGDEVSRQRFCREARAAASISHENVVAVHQVERAGEEGLPYLVMQLISGESLEQRLTREKRLPQREIVRISTQVAHGLAAAYSQGLIHRDIKPGNILLEDSHDSVKLTDFGLARAAEDVKLTRTGFVSGTPLYMAPEQAMGDEPDHRSDLFSLGAIMYEMCAGQPPFTGNSALAILRQISDTKHRPLRELNPQTPEWLAETIDQLLAKKPEDRIQTAHHLAELLEFHLALMKTSEDVPTVCKIEQEKETKRNRRMAVAIGAVFSLLGLFGGVFLANRGWVPAGRPGPNAVVTAGVAPIAVLSANAGTVWSVGFDLPDKTVVMGVEDGSVRLWDIASQSVKSTFLAHRGIVWSSMFSHTCEVLATAGDDGLIKIWDVSKSEPLREFHSPNAVRGLAFSHDGTQLFAGDRNGGLRVWGTKSGETIAETQIPRSAIYSVAVSPDDETLATAGSDNVVRLWNAKTLVQKLPLEGHSGPVYGVAFSRDGHRLASVGWDKQVRIWDVNSGLPVRTWDGLSNDLWGVAFSPDGTKLATGGHDGGVRLWNAETGELIETYSGHKITVHTVAFDHDGKMLASGSRDGSVKIWPVP